MMQRSKNANRYFHVLAKAIPGDWILKGDAVDGRNHTSELTSDEVERLNCVGMGLKFYHTERDYYIGKVVQQVISSNQDIIVILELPPAPDPDSVDGQAYECIRANIIEGIESGRNNHVSVTMCPVGQVNGPDTITYNRTLSEISIVDDPRRDGADIMAYRWDDVSMGDASTPPIRPIPTSIDITFKLAGAPGNEYIIETFTRPKSAADININAWGAEDKTDNINITNDKTENTDRDAMCIDPVIVDNTDMSAPPAPASTYNKETYEALMAKMAQMNEELQIEKANAAERLRLEAALAEKNKMVEEQQKRIAHLEPQAEQSILMAQQRIEENKKAYIDAMNAYTATHAAVISQVTPERAAEMQAENKALSGVANDINLIATTYFENEKARNAAEAKGIAHVSAGKDRDREVASMIQDSHFLNIVANKTTLELIEINKALNNEIKRMKGTEMLEQHMNTKQQQQQPTLTPVASLSASYAEKIAQHKVQMGSNTTTSSSSSTTATAPPAAFNNSFANTTPMTVEQLRAKGILPPSYGNRAIS
jgi:hypothetical protein